MQEQRTRQEKKTAPKANGALRRCFARLKGLRREGTIPKDTPHMKRSALILCLSLCALTPLGALFVLLAKRNPDALEKFYSLGFYKEISSLLGAVTGRFPFSLAEALIITLSVCVLAGAVLFIVKAVRAKGHRLRFFAQSLLRLAAVLSAAFFIYLASGGLNYYRRGFTYYSGHNIQPVAFSVLEEFCESLTHQTNALRRQCQSDEAGVFTVGERSFDQFVEAAQKGYEQLDRIYPYGIFTLGTKNIPKGVFFSEAMSYMQIVGVFFPFTAEANLNVHGPDFTYLAAITHEMAHICGFMREDEANFLAYKASMLSGDAELMYSASLKALMMTHNAIYAQSPEAYARAAGLLDGAVIADIRANSEYYAKYETSFGDFSNAVNDVYLKANSQSDGVKSYGRMLDLLIAEYLQEQGIV